MKRFWFWSLLAITMSLYALILVWSLPTVAAAAGGLSPFDVRPLGYSFDEALAFLAALSPNGSEFYRTTQHLLDAAYPPLASLTLFFAILRLARSWAPWHWLAASVALPIAAFDLAENFAVDQMLAAGTSALTPELVAQASLYTGLKSGLTTATMTILLIAALGRAWSLARRLGVAARPRPATSK